MFKFKASSLIAFSGMIWLAVGLYLLPLGLNFLIQSAKSGPSGPLFSLFSPQLLTYEEAALAFVVIGLGIGYLKGKTVFAKTVRKSVERIISLEAPIPISKIYNLRYCLLLGLMICLGVSFKYFDLSQDIRGLVDIAIGSALINGAMIYFRQALAVRKSEQA